MAANARSDVESTMSWRNVRNCMEKARSYRTIAAMFLELCFVALIGPTPIGQAQSDPTQPGSASTTQAQDGSALSRAPDVSYEDQVLSNLQHKDIGPVKLESLALPPEYLRRVADRIIQSSFEEQFRIVVPDPKPMGADPNAQSTAADGASERRGTWLKVAGAVVGALFVLIGSTIMRRRQAGAR
jgi:hypothetical protein